MNGGKRGTVGEEGESDSVTITTGGNVNRSLKDRNLVFSAVCFKLVNYISSRQSTSKFQNCFPLRSPSSVTAG